MLIIPQFIYTCNAVLHQAALLEGTWQIDFYTLYRRIKFCELLRKFHLARYEDMLQSLVIKIVWSWLRNSQMNFQNKTNQNPDIDLSLYEN